LIRDHFIFDMDGVLIDSEPAHQQIFKKVFEELNLDFSVAYHHTLVGMAAVPMWEKIRSDFHIQTDARELMNFHKEFMYVSIKELDIQLVPGALELLQRLEDMQLKMSLASSSAEKLIHHFVDKFNIGSKFDFIVSGESLTRSKPFPDIFLKVAELYNLQPDRFLVIEDSNNGVRAAKSAQMQCVGYNNPNSGQQDLSLADEVISSFLQLDNSKIKQLIS
jgi:HAD superfamily hydrolase (TIGR01509 family)